MTNVLEIKNLAKKYDNFALKNISFSLPQGMELEKRRQLKPY